MTEGFFLRQFFVQTLWNHENHYSQITLPSRTILDFAPPSGLQLNLSHRPTSGFLSGVSLATLSSSNLPAQVLSGNLFYAASSVPIPQLSTKSSQSLAEIDLKSFAYAFTPGPLPLKPDLREEATPTWLAGERVEKQDFLLYGKLYAPKSRLDALWVHRHSQTVQTIVSLVSVPVPQTVAPLSWNDDERQPAPSVNHTRQSELEFKLQQDTGRWSTEWSYSLGDSLVGLKGLYNFGRSGGGDAAIDTLYNSEKRERVVDEEEELGTGLRGRWSAGGEVYISTKGRSAGFSTALRFSTLPEFINGVPSGIPSQPPTVLTCTLSPIMGQLSAAYTVASSRDIGLCSRFDFNMYSYEADLSVGAEWFQRRGKRENKDSTPQPKLWDAFGRNVSTRTNHAFKQNPDEVTGVFRARLSTNSDASVMWEGKLGSFLVSLGLNGDLQLLGKQGGRRSPFKSVGLGLQYWG